MLKAEPGFGLGIMLHCTPFQCRVRVPDNPLLLSTPSPTAHTSFVEIAVTPFSSPMSRLPKLGITDHANPSQCMVSVPVIPAPTAHTSLAVSIVTAYKEPA